MTPSSSPSASALDLALRPWPLVAATALGLSAGAMLTEAALLVGIWRAMPPAAFLRWFADHEPALVAFYGPLQASRSWPSTRDNMRRRVRGRCGRARQKTVRRRQTAASSGPP